MKKCSKCGRLYSDMVSTCSNCGAPLDGASKSGNAVKSNSIAPSSPIQTPPTPQPAPLATPAVVPPDGNMGKGILGAALYAIGGAVCTAVLLNLGYVAALSGILTMFLAVLGYRKFSDCSENYSIKVTLLCIGVSFVMLFLGHYIGFLILGKNTLAEDGYFVTLFEVAQLVHEIPDLQEAFWGDFAMSLAFWAISGVVALFRRRK